MAGLVCFITQIICVSSYRCIIYKCALIEMERSCSGGLYSTTCFCGFILKEVAVIGLQGASVCLNGTAISRGFIVREYTAIKINCATIQINGTALQS